MEFSYLAEVMVAEKCRRYRQHAEKARMLLLSKRLESGYSARHQLAQRVRKVADWLEPEAASLGDLERTI